MEWPPCDVGLINRYESLILISQNPSDLKTRVCAVLPTFFSKLVNTRFQANLNECNL